ncbi:MAG: preprotein translocase subunit SecE [Oscillospiraceae bacterium]|nr:preprotein translocase subunit SecE [Oscillospiraceae bacterium]
MAEEKKMNAAPAKAVTAVKKDDAKPGFFKRVAKWFREMKSELKKVVWPTGKQLFNNTFVSVAVMLASAVVLWGFDSLASWFVQGIITLTTAR